jgi:hypothetical protein
LTLLTKVFLFSGLALSLNAATLTHFYPFTNGATDTVGGADGTLLGGATVSGGRLVLDGADDYVQFATPLIVTSGSYSVFLEENMTAFPAGLYTEMISQGGGFYLGSGPSHEIRVGDSWSNAGAFPAPGPHSFAVTVDMTGPGATLLYIDGVLFNSRVGAASPTSENTRLSRQYNGHSEYFPGSLDNVQIYTGVLSAQDVAGLAGLNNVPEPWSMSMMGAGILAIGLYRRRQSR